jgi:hypothetical protein
MPFGPKCISIYNSQGVQMFKQKVAAECVKRDTSHVWQGSGLGAVV